MFCVRFGVTLSIKATDLRIVWPIIICVYSKGCTITLGINHFDNKRENSVFNELNSLFCRNNQTSQADADVVFTQAAQTPAAPGSWASGGHVVCYPGDRTEFQTRVPRRTAAHDCVQRGNLAFYYGQIFPVSGFWCG